MANSEHKPLTVGSYWLEEEGEDPVFIEPGTFTLIPHGEGHRLSSALGVAAPHLFDLPREQVSERCC